jgi:succinate-semialdehyde dehydrogenase/glutarate-semialdehyde dehydrogenase
MNARDRSGFPSVRQYIAGEWREGGMGMACEVRNPATGEVLAEVPRASQQDLDDALSAASVAFDLWRFKSPQERAAVLMRTSTLIRDRVEDMARIMTMEQGKTLAESRMEFTLCAETFEWYAQEGLRSYGRVIPSRVRGTRQLAIPQPLGPVVALTPWNFPALLPARKIAPALAAGCSIILKPSEETPVSALLLAQALTDAGLPAGVLNMVMGVPSEISSYLIKSPIIRKVTFTGSTAVGRELASMASVGPKPCTLELGGHAPVLIFDDADLDRTVATCVIGKTRNAGQVCTSPTRFLVQDGIHDAFVASFSKALNTLQVGPGLDSANQMGALANSRRLSAMESMVADTLFEGGQLKTGGKRIGERGNFFQPTLISEVPLSAKAMHNEPFGPIALVRRFSTLEDGLAAANNTPFGLAAYLFTQSAATAATVSEELQAGGIGINTFAVSAIEAPFGGLKDSGYGHEGGPEGLESFQHMKYVHHA